MADNVAVTAGTGTNIVTDDISNTNKHYQRVKISDGTADSEVHLKVFAEDGAIADGDTGLLIFAKRTAAPADTSGTEGDAEPLQVKDGRLWVSPLGFPVTLSTDITRPADTTTYASGDNWADSTSAPTSGGFTLTGAARKSGGSGIITDIMIASSAVPATRLSGEIWFFNAAVTNINDNAAFVLTDAEIKTCVGIVPFTLISAGANNSIAQCYGLNMMFTCVGSANLRYLVRVRNAYVPVSAEVLTVMAKILQID